jgi:uncharacterized protein YeaC (DUF1315 family)
MDMQVAQFESDTEKSVDRSNWGLPEPNRPASYTSLGKYAKGIPALDDSQVEALNKSFQWMERCFAPYMQGSRVKSQEEAVVGLDKTTSPGFPWTRKYAKKRAMCEEWKDFEKYMGDDWDRLRNKRYVAVFGNSLKEEVRPRVKIDANSIRTFTAGPIEMTIHGNRLFEDMNERFYASHLQSPSVVGFSPLKRGWDALIRKLKKHPNGFALDESQYDSSLRAYMMWAVAEFRWRMLRSEDQTPEMKERLLSYYRNLVNTMIITSDGVFVLKQGGNPSGSVNTISDNTLILFILLAYGWIMVVPDELCNYEAFCRETSLALCGDDNTWTVSDVAVPFFNARALIEVWDHIGVTTTTDCMDPRPVDELDFLSAFTVYIDGVAVPLYNREKLLTSLLYSRHPDDAAFTLVRACALLRIAWADVQMRDYLKELITWLVQRFGPVLSGTNEWRLAMTQIPTEFDLRQLFLADEVLLPQSFSGGPLSSRNRIKREIELRMNGQIALPQRQRQQRVPRGTRGPRRSRRLVPRLIGPRMPLGNFLSGGSRRGLRPRRRGGRRRGRG